MRNKREKNKWIKRYRLYPLFLTPFYFIPSFSHLQPLDDHKNTPDDRPDPTEDDDDADKLDAADDDISGITTESAGDDGADAREEDVDNTADNGDDALTGDLETLGTRDDVVDETHL